MLASTKAKLIFSKEFLTVGVALKRRGYTYVDLSNCLFYCPNSPGAPQKDPANKRKIKKRKKKQDCSGPTVVEIQPDDMGLYPETKCEACGEVLLQYWADPTGPYKIIKKHLLDMPAEDLAVLRKEAFDRIEEHIKKLWAKQENSPAWAAAYKAALESERKLLGVDAPTKTQVSGTVVAGTVALDDLSPEELKRLSAAVAALGLEEKE